MNRLWMWIAAGLCLLGGWGQALRAETGTWPLGVLGIKGARMPPPGQHATYLFYYYTADQINDENGDPFPTGLPIDAAGEVNVAMNFLNLLWITDYQVLGANYGFGATIAAGEVQDDMSLVSLGVSGSRFSFTDAWFEPINLSWHLPQLDAFVAYSFFAPTGDYGPGVRINTGRGRWTNLLGAGAVYYFDKEQTWSLSAVTHYEIHSEQEGEDLTAGDCVDLEWGVGKTFVFGLPEDAQSPSGRDAKKMAEAPTAAQALPSLVVDVGAVGYGQWQVTRDKGAPPIGIAQALDQVCGAGVEVSVVFPRLNALLFKVRHIREFGVEARTEGSTTVVIVGVTF